jgi:exodeoxyribonuclease V gamma subunit
MKKIVSNRLDQLCQLLADKISKSENGVFAKEVIVTQTSGMNAWLKTELAQRNGVLAQFQFQNQDGLFAEIYKLLFGKSMSNQFDNNKYTIYGLLDSEAFTAQFTDVAQYYYENPKRRFDLATKIADLFDQYQLYRPEMIASWDNINFMTDNASEKWQQWLWKKLDVQSKGNIKEELLVALKTNKELIQKNFPHISLFGISIFTPFHIDFFRALASCTTVEAYLCLPTNTGIFKNDLLISYGAKAKELIELLGIIQVEILPSTGCTLLGQLQNSIFTNSADKLEFIGDDSIQINSCYTPVREVECLYNYLLDLFEKDSTLQPRDVLVMTTDIDTYSPFVKAVFRNAPVKIPFQVSGAANNSGENIVSTLEHILTFTSEDLTSEKVVSLLEQKRIKKQFQVVDCGYIRSVVNKVNIRFGKSNNTDDDTHFVSWEYGLEKILLGYAILSDKEFEGKYPFRDAEASASHDMFRLKGFFDCLCLILEVENTDRTLGEWKLFLFEEVIGQLIYTDDFSKEDRDEVSTIYRALSFIDQLEMQEKVPFALFLSELKSKLFTEPGEIKLNTGRVTVTSPVSVRGIPYKVICFLGLNNGIFPRQDIKMGFDLMGTYIPGDRSKKDTDKLLFLDTLLAAREKMYLSYIGQSIKDNSEIPPSIVLDTLMEYTKIKAVEHPLQGFGSKYRADDKRLFTYLYTSKPTSFESKESVRTELIEMPLNSFLKFFEHPIKWYFNSVLEIYYNEQDDNLPETELFELNGLQQWVVKEDLLRENELEIYLNREIKQGKLPLKNMGRITVEDQWVKISELKVQYELLTKGKDEQNIIIDLPIDNVRITGTINNVYDRQYVAYTVSKNALKYKVGAYLKILILCAENKIESALFIDLNGNVTNLPCLTDKEAIDKLNNLMYYLKTGRLEPLKFTLEAAEVASNPKKTVEDVLKKMIDQANGNTFSNLPPDPYLQRLYEEGSFDSFDDKNFEVIKVIASLLNIKVD